MIKLKATEDFSLKRFNEVVDLVRNSKRDNEGMIYKGDIFKCNSDLADYLCGNNPLNRAVIEIIEIEPSKEEIEIKKVEKKTIQPKKATQKKSKI